MKQKIFKITTSAGGAFTEVGPAIHGRLFAVDVNQGDLTDGAADITLSMVNTSSGVDKTLLTLTDVTANALYYPRDVVHGETGSALTGTSGGDREMPLMDGNLKCVVAQGGATKSGTVVVHYFEDL